MNADTLVDEARATPRLKREYWCFISYRHADNKEPGRQWATWLHQALETYEVPADLVGTTSERGDIIPERIFPVFRDEEELPADAELSKPIEAALRRSRFLVVLCSPQAVQSRFVADEILRFKQLGKQDRILAAIIEGVPNASADPTKGGTENECFPHPLRFAVNENGQLTSERTEPIAANFRIPDGTQGWTSPAAYREALDASGLPDKQIETSVSQYTNQQNLMLLKIVAGVLGVALGVLTRRDKAYQLAKQRQRAKVLRRWLMLVGVLSVSALIAAALAWQQRGLAVAKGKEAIDNYDTAVRNEARAKKNEIEAAKEARRAEDEAAKALAREVETKRILSLADFRRADALVTENRQAEALAYLARAVRVNPDNVAAVRRALFMLQQGEWWWARPLKAPKGMEMADAVFGADERARVLAVGPGQEGMKRPIGVFDDEGKAVFSALDLEGHDIVARFIEESDVFMTRIDQEPPQFWSSLTGKAAVPPAEWNRRRKVAEQAKEKGFDDLKFCIAGNRLAAWHPGQRSFSVFDLKSGKRVIDDFEVGFGISEAVFTPDCEQLIVAGGIDIEDVHHGDIATCQVGSEPELRRWETSGPLFDHTITFMRLLPDGDAVIVSSENAAELWSVQGHRLCNFTETGEKPGSGVVAARPDGQALVVGQQYWQKWGRRAVSTWPGEDASDMMDIDADPMETLAKLNEHLVKGEWCWIYRELAADARNPPPEMDEYFLMPAVDYSVLVGSTADGHGIIIDGKSGAVLRRFAAPSYTGVVAASAARFILRHETSGAEVWDLAAAKPMGVVLSSFDRVVSAQFHPDGHRVLIASEDRRGQMWNAVTGERLGDPIHLLDFSPTNRFAKDGAWFVSETTGDMLGSGNFQVWDTETMLPLSAPVFSGDIGGGEAGQVALVGGAHMGPHGKLCLRTTIDSLPPGSPGGATLVFNLPAANRQAPAWFPGFCEAVARHRISDAGAVKPMSAAELATALELTRKALADDDENEILSAVVRWWLDDTPERKVSPASPVRVLEVVEKRLAMTSPEPLEQALKLAPQDARIPARLAGIYHAMDAESKQAGEDQGEAAARAALKANFHSRHARALDPSVVIPKIELPKPKSQDEPPAPKSPADNPSSFGIPMIKIGSVMVATVETRKCDFARFVAETGYKAQGTDGKTWDHPGFRQTDDDPVVCVSWDDAQAFCRWMTEWKQQRGWTKTGRIRLPTDAEWSILAGTKMFPWGDEWPPAKGIGNYAGKELNPKSELPDDGFLHTAPATNELKIRVDADGHPNLPHIGGNVWEWCEDWYDLSMNQPQVIAASPALQKLREPRKYRVMRGGSWTTSDRNLLRSDTRLPGVPTEGDTNNGFRIVMDEG